MPSFKPVNGELKILLANERLETHYINRLNLIAVDTDHDAKSYLMNTISMASVSSMQPLSASDYSDNSILDLVQKSDGSYWESDVRHMNVWNDFEDMIEVTFLFNKAVKNAPSLSRPSIRRFLIPYLGKCLTF